MRSFLGNVINRFTNYASPPPVPATPFKNGFDAFMKTKDPTYDSYTKLFEKIGENKSEESDFVQQLLDEFLKDIENFRNAPFPETATTILDQIKRKGEMGANFESAMVTFFDELHDEVLIPLFIKLHDSLKDATVNELQTNDNLHVEAYLVALLWLLIYHLYNANDLYKKLSEETLKDYKDFQYNKNVFAAALLLAKQAPRFETYADAFYAFYTGKVESLSLSNLIEAKTIFLEFSKPYELKAKVEEDKDRLETLKTELEEESLSEVDKAKLEEEVEELTKKVTEEVEKIKVTDAVEPKKAPPSDENVVHRSTFIFTSMKGNQPSYMVLTMGDKIEIPADYVPLGQPSLDADGNILQVFTNRPKDMFPLLVEGTVLMTG